MLSLNSILFFTISLSVLAQIEVDFTNFCQTAAGEFVNGQQTNAQACSQTIQGLIPDISSMVSTLITSPQDGSDLIAAEGFQVTFSTINMITGLLQNPDEDFHAFPQTLDPQTGIIEGGNSVAIQKLVSGNVPDAQSLSFFNTTNEKNNNAIGQTTFTIDIPSGAIKTTGPHRICTGAMTAGFAPVIMPIAQRGAQNDCVRVNIQ